MYDYLSVRCFYYTLQMRYNVSDLIIDRQDVVHINRSSFVSYNGPEILYSLELSQAT
jgi:hypothetical protein